MKSLVISGGGCKGAFAGGILEYLDKDYDLLVGTSTGSLIVPLIAAHEIPKLKLSYTNTTQESIFKVNPFKIKTDLDGNVSVGMDVLNILYNVVIRRQKSFGDSSNLRKNIEAFIDEKDFNLIKKLKKEVLICVTNVEDAVAEYKSINDYSLSDFHDWIWASTSAYPFMSSVIKDGKNYVDGGFTDPCPIQEAINRGATEIDAIMLRTEDGGLEKKSIKNPIQGLGRMFDVMLKEINKNDIQIASLNSINNDVILNIYYTPRILTNESLIFDKKVMEGWWLEGYEYARNRNQVSFLIKNDKHNNELIYRG